MAEINQKKQEATEEPGSILGALINYLSPKSSTGLSWLIGMEAALALSISIFFAIYTGILEAGLASLALASAAIVPRVNQILRINRERIWNEGVPAWQANRRSVTSGTVLLMAMVITYSIFAALADRELLTQRFTFIGANYTTDLLTPERFENGFLFFKNNSMILVLFFILSFVFRGLGTSLALGWNAGVWSVTIVLMVRTGIGGSENPFLYSGLVIMAILPHLIIEGLSYITASLAGIFLSRGITLYDFANERLIKVLRAVVSLLIVSFIILALGALVEHYWAPFILKWL